MSIDVLFVRVHAQLTLWFVVAFARDDLVHGVALARAVPVRREKEEERREQREGHTHRH